MSLEALMKTHGIAGPAGYYAGLGAETERQRNDATLAELLASTRRRDAEEQRNQEKHPLTLEQMGHQNAGMGIQNRNAQFDVGVKEQVGQGAFAEAKLREFAQKNQDFMVKAMDNLGNIAGALKGLPAAARPSFAREAFGRIMPPEIASHFAGMVDADPDKSPDQLIATVRQMAELNDKYIIATDKQNAANAGRLAVEDARTDRAMKLQRSEHNLKWAIAQLRASTEGQKLLQKAANRRFQGAYLTFLEAANDPKLPENDRRHAKFMAENIQQMIAVERTFGQQPFGTILAPDAQGNMGLQQVPRRTEMPPITPPGGIPQQQGMPPVRAPQQSPVQPQGAAPQPGRMSAQQYLEQFRK
jgi:hypothetical protein